MEDRDNWSDKEVIAAFTRMLRTVIMWVPWFGITLYFAVAKDWAFFDRPDIPTWAHILFFAWLVVTLPLLAWLTLKKIWKM